MLSNGSLSGMTFLSFKRLNFLVVMCVCNFTCFRINSRFLCLFWKFYIVHKGDVLPLYFIKRICIQKIEVQYSINSNYSVVPPDEETIACFPPRLVVAVAVSGPCYPTSLALFIQSST